MRVTYEDAKDAAASIRKAVDPYSIVLFGSVAREGSGNDLDLLILIEDGERSIEDAGSLVQNSLKPYYKKFSIDPFILPLSKCREYQKRGSPFLHLISKEGRMLFMKDIVAEWINQARDELDMAVYLLQGGYFKGACYHAQQSVEKAMKAGLFKKGWELEKTHSAARLAAIGQDLRVKFPLSEEEIVFVDGIYRGRYPAEAGLLPWGSPTREEAEKSVNLAGKLIKSVSRKRR
jgi:HEPN domain-containing protein/predicted nucleotidyltransferase